MSGSVIVIVINNFNNIPIAIVALAVPASCVRPVSSRVVVCSWCFLRWEGTLLFNFADFPRLNITFLQNKFSWSPSFKSSQNDGSGDVRELFNFADPLAGGTLGIYTFTFLQKVAGVQNDINFAGTLNILFFAVKRPNRPLQWIRSSFP